MIILDPSLKREKTFHENKFSLGEDFYHRYKYEPLWRVCWKRKFKNIYTPLRKLEQDTYILNIGAGTGPVEFFLSKENKNFKNFISTDISINAIQNLKYLDLNNNLLIHTSNKLKPILINRGSFNSNYSNSNCNSNKVHHRINLHLIHNSSMDSNHTYLNNSYHNNSYSKVDTSLKDSKVNKMLVVSNMVNHNSSVNTHLVRATFL